MLAYVFWHVPRPSVEAREYETAHREFHDALWESKVAGLLGLDVYAIETIPWLGGRAGYEDWHLLEGSVALDVLNGAAISQARRLPHDRIAALAADGTAGLYSPRLGSPGDVAQADWMSKPTGMSYHDFEATLKPHIDEGCCLWGRRMTLGPTPEFCLHAPTMRRPPDKAHSIAMRPVLRYGRA